MCTQTSDLKTRQVRGPVVGGFPFNVPPQSKQHQCTPSFIVIVCCQCFGSMPLWFLDLVAMITPDPSRMDSRVSGMHVFLHFSTWLNYQIP